MRNSAETRHIDYNHLGLPCGSRANLQMIPDMAKHRLPLKTLGDELQRSSVGVDLGAKVALRGEVRTGF